MAKKTLRELFHDTLKDIYFADRRRRARIVREMFSYIVSNQMVEGSVCIGLRASCRVCARQLSVAHDARRATRKAPLSYSRPH
jgi:hypothetical protein